MKKNLPLIVGIALPILFIIIISVVVFGPSLFIKPQHNFIYSTLENDYYTKFRNDYQIINGQITLQPITKPIQGYPESTTLKEGPKLFLYDVKKDSVHEIAFIDVQKLSLDPGPSSEDGYVVEYRNNYSDGIFGIFGGNYNNNNGYFISKGRSGKKITNLGSNGSYYYQNSFKFIGWIK